jgi:biotin carboxyl carrier protein
MWPFDRRRKVRALRAGVVQSVRVGARTRITVAGERYFVVDSKVSVGEKVKKGSVLGYV